MDSMYARYNLELPEMETQHEYLFCLFDKLNSIGGNDKMLSQLIDEIERYILFHFECEEHLMRIYNYSDFAAHQNAHEQFSVKLVSFLDDHDKNILNIQALRIYLTGWLMEHSVEADAFYVNWILAERRKLTS